MSDYGDFDDVGGGYGDDWMYVEDYWDEANELAEYTCPSPVPLDEVAVHTDDYDVHDYWQDIEYISDGGYYEDHRSPQRKRKPDQEPAARSSRIKRRKNIVDGERQPLLGMSTVLFIPQRDRNHSLYAAFDASSDSTSSQLEGPVALLKDWKERFKNTTGLGSFTSSEPSLGTDHQQVLAGEGFDLSDLQSVANLLNEENVQAVQQMLETQGLDPEALQLVIQDLLEGKERTFEDESETEDHPPEEEAERSKRPRPSHGARDHEMDDLPGSLQAENHQTEHSREAISFATGNPGGARSPDMPSRGTRSKRKVRPDIIVADENPERGRKKRKHG